MTVDAAIAPQPQGKAGRTRHRLPRQKVRPTGQSADGDAPADEVRTLEVASGDAEVVEELGPTIGSADADADAEPDPRPDDLEPADTEPTDIEAADVASPKRRRLPWRRAKATVTTAHVEPDPEPPVATADEASESRGETLTAPAELADIDAADEIVGDPDQPEPVLVPHRPAGRVLKVAAIAAGALFVAAGAFAGATIEPYLADRAAVHTKFQIAETAASAITTLWTYTPDDMNTLPERSAKFLGGDFAADYRRYIDAIIEPNKQAQVSNDTQVLGVAVESLTPQGASALVYTNSVATSPVTKGIPSLRYLSYRLMMEERDGQWFVTRMTAVTSLDLTPKL